MMEKKRKALITGGAGFIGGHLAGELLAHGYRVTLADDFSRGVRDSFLEKLEGNPDISLVSADLSNRENTLTLEGDFQYIYHLAAVIGVKNVMERPYETLEKNVRLLVNLIEFARRQKNLDRFVFASTSEVYAGTLKFYGMEMPTPETTPLTVTPLDHPRTSYMLSKIYGEALIRQSGLPFTIVRPHNFYGPRMGMSHVIPELLKKAYFLKDGEKLVVFSVRHKRTFCYIGDAVKAVRKLAEEPAAEGQEYNIGNESPEVTMEETANLILRVTGRHAQIDAKPAAPGSPERRCPSMKKAEGVIGPMNGVPLEEGIRKTFDWYKTYIFDGKENGAQ